jgi:hypothetical protein
MMGEVAVHEVEVRTSSGIGLHCCPGDNVNTVDLGAPGTWTNHDIVVEDNAIDDAWQGD